MTPAQEALLQRLVAALSQDGRVKALWLSGSLGAGSGDAWSDIDLVALVSPDDLKACVADYKQPRPGLPETVLAFDVYGVVVASVTADWERFDIHFATRDYVDRAGGDGWRPLFGDTAIPPRPPPAPGTGAPGRVAATVTEFLRVLGLMPVAVGRQEWITAQQGFDLLRRMMIDLMLEENGHGQTARGAKRLNGFLTPGQREALEAITPPRADREAVIAANLDLARAFLARARPLAARLGAAWPQAFEDATRRHLKAALSLDL